MRLLIEGGRLIEPASARDEECDLLIEEGRVKALEAGLREKLPAGTAFSDFEAGRALEAGTVAVIDARGLVVAPGLVDIHVHLREPGFEYKETIATGTRSAAAGGFTAVACMPNTEPANDSGAVTESILKEAASGGAAKVYPVGAVSKARQGKELAEIGDLAEAGCVAISDDGSPVLDSGLMRRAMEYAGRFGLTVIDHCEDTRLSRDGCMHEGPLATEMGLAGWPAAAEEVLVARNILLAEALGRPVHMAHVSTAGTVRLMREAKARGVAVTCEVTPHHLALTDEAVRGYDTNAKMNPPLRSAEHLKALREGLADGTIDAVASDHAPHALSEKEIEFDQAAFGVVGLETALGLVLKLVEEGLLSLPQAIERMTWGPARCLNLPAGRLEVGGAADVVLIDPEARWTVDASKFYSKGRNTPFSGWELKGLPRATILDGRVVFTQEAGVLI